MLSIYNVIIIFVSTLLHVFVVDDTFTNSLEELLLCLVVAHSSVKLHFIKRLIDSLITSKYHIFDKRLLCEGHRRACSVCVHVRIQ